MVFSSITFLYYFLPIVLIAYLILPFKNSVLLIASLMFYAWGEPRYIILMLLTVLVNYLCGLKIAGDHEHSKYYLITALIFSIGALVAFKYTDFIIMTFNMIPKVNIPLTKIGLPIGISFYTFQTLSYTIDVYRGDVAVQKNYFTLLTYVSLFPQLIAGPIVRYSDVELELENRQPTVSMIYDGILRFTIGLCKKVILANTLGEIVNGFVQQSNPSVTMYWLYALAFTLQIYYDFSGYSDMAIGLGKIFGFNFFENFNYPFTASSITDFWRRWHISLGSFFRDYVYIPLGGSRVSTKRWIFNILVVWSLTGLWHGASWNFVIWGLMFAIFLMLEKVFRIDTKKRSLLGTLYVFLIVLLSFVIFDASSFTDIIQKFSGMFGLLGNSMSNIESQYYSSHYAFVLIIALLGTTKLPKNLFNKIIRTQSEKRGLVIQFSLILIGFALSTILLVDANFNPFLYFRF